MHADAAPAASSSSSRLQPAAPGRRTNVSPQRVVTQHSNPSRDVTVHCQSVPATTRTLAKWERRWK